MVLRGAWLATTVAGVALALGGCGSGEDADREAITELMSTLRLAQERGDARLACSDVYLVQERDRAPEAEGKEECLEAFPRAEAVRRAAVKDLRTELTDIQVDGDTATAVLRTRLRRADGSPLEQDATYDLVRTARGWRVRIAGEG